MVKHKYLLTLDLNLVEEARWIQVEVEKRENLSGLVNDLLKKWCDENRGTSIYPICEECKKKRSSVPNAILCRTCELGVQLNSLEIGKQWQRVQWEKSLSEGKAKYKDAETRKIMEGVIRAIKAGTYYYNGEEKRLHDEFAKLKLKEKNVKNES